MAIIRELSYSISVSSHLRDVSREKTEKSSFLVWITNAWFRLTREPRWDDSISHSNHSIWILLSTTYSQGINYTDHRYKRARIHSWNVKVIVVVNASNYCPQNDSFAAEWPILRTSGPQIGFSTATNQDKMALNKIKTHLHQRNKSPWFTIKEDTGKLIIIWHMQRGFLCPFGGASVL